MEFSVEQVSVTLFETVPNSKRTKGGQSRTISVRGILVVTKRESCRRISRFFVVDKLLFLEKCDYSVYLLCDFSATSLVRFCFARLLSHYLIPVAHLRDNISLRRSKRERERAGQRDITAIPRSPRSQSFSSSSFSACSYDPDEPQFGTRRNFQR